MLGISLWLKLVDVDSDLILYGVEVGGRIIVWLGRQQVSLCVPSRSTRPCLISRHRNPATVPHKLVLLSHRPSPVQLAFIETGQSFIVRILYGNYSLQVLVVGGRFII